MVTYQTSVLFVERVCSLCSILTKIGKWQHSSPIILIVNFQADTSVLFAMLYADRRAYGPTYVTKFLAVAFANASI
jgi:hypothetical protein